MEIIRLLDGSDSELYSAPEIADELDMYKNNVYTYLNDLRDVGIVELAEEDPKEYQLAVETTSEVSPAFSSFYDGLRDRQGLFQLSLTTTIAGVLIEIVGFALHLHSLLPIGNFVLGSGLTLTAMFALLVKHYTK